MKTPNTTIRFFSDTWEITKRNLIRYRRSPRLLFFATVQPIMFVLLFAYVFGSAIEIPGIEYINYLIPAIIVQTVLFGAGNTAVGLSDDITKGLMDRFRSLPMSHAAVLAGRTMADSFRNLFTITVMIAVGYAIGFRISTSFPEALAAVGLALLFGFAIQWIMAAIGTTVKDGETAQMASMVIMFPLTFASSAFVPTESMAAGLRWFAQHSPVTYSIDTLRSLFIGGDVQSSVWYMLAWIVIIIAVFFPLSVRQFNKTT